MTTVTLLVGQGSPNIGNAFFQLGGAWLIKHCWPQADVKFISDMAGHLLPWKIQKLQGNPTHDANILAHLQTDIVVLQGPMLNRGFAALYGHALRTLKANGTKIFLISAGMNKYDTEEEDVSKLFLTEIKPDLLVTRDEPTFKIFKDFARVAHCGIDSAFFCPRAYDPAKLRDPYIAMSCDQTLEPHLEVAAPNDHTDVLEVSPQVRIKIVPRKGLAARLRSGGRAGKAVSYLIPKQYPTSFQGMEIIRAFHKTSPYSTRWIYQAPNTHASDEPFTYLSLYAHSKVTITDRVHAAIITLTYGNPVLFLGKTNRAHLFNHVCPDVNKRILARVDPTHLANLMQKQIAAMSAFPV